jgi:hypothetical protein
MAKYTKRTRQEIERLTAGGKFTDDWIDIRRPSLVDFERAQMRLIGDDSRLARIHMAASIIVAWSFTDEAGNALPVSYDEIAAADGELSVALEPVFDRVTDFLMARALANASAETSTLPAEDIAKPDSPTIG